MSTPVKSFSPAGMAVKAYYGGPGWPQGGAAGAGGRGGWVAPGTLGNPGKATSGGGAFGGGANPNGPNQGGGGTPAGTIVISSDHIAVFLQNQGGTQLSTLLAAAGLLTAWNNGTLPVLNIKGDGLSGRPGGYWVISGVSTAVGTLDGVGLWIDTAPNSACTINIDSSQLRFYGAGGFGGSGNPGPNLPSDGGHAIFFSLNTGTGPVNLNITNQVGANTGFIIGGGAGGPGGFGAPSGGNGGGGAGGWIGGLPGNGGGLNVPAAQAGGVYDLANGGTGNLAVAGGAGGSSGVNVGGNGGGLAQSTPQNNFSVGATGGFAVIRSFGSPAGTTVIVSGGANIIGTVQ